MQPLLPSMGEALQPLLLSLKPHYADLVFDGLKKAELRRRIASHIENRDVFIYVSSPIMVLRGGFRVGEVWYGEPENVWNMVSNLASVEKQDFDTYFEGRTIAYALEIKEVWEYCEPVSLAALRNQFSKFVIPQSWRYVRPEEYQFFLEVEPQKKEFLEQRQENSDYSTSDMSLFNPSNCTHSECDNRRKAFVSVI